MDFNVDLGRSEFEIYDISRMMCRVHDVGERAFQRKREQSIANQAAVDVHILQVGLRTREARQTDPARQAHTKPTLVDRHRLGDEFVRSEEHTSELQSLMRLSYAVFCLKKKNKEA